MPFFLLSATHRKPAGTDRLGEVLIEIGVQPLEGGAVEAVGRDGGADKILDYADRPRDGGADKILDYADRPSFCLYSSGLSPPREILIRFSRYQTI